VTFSRYHPQQTCRYQPRSLVTVWRSWDRQIAGRR